jgi:hypothetical protein
LQDEATMKKKAIVCSTHEKKNVKRSNVYNNIAKKVAGVKNKTDNKATKDQQLPKQENYEQRRRR